MIPFYQPYLNHSELLAAIRPGRGRTEFESAVARRLGATFGIAFPFGRSGLFASLKALRIVDSEIVMTAYTCVIVAQAVLASGNRPVFVDIDLADYNWDLDKFQGSLTPNTKAVIATHLYGYSTDIGAIRDIVGDERIVIIEDCAQKLPASLEKPNPLNSDIGLCSFGLNKELCTVEGGVIVTNSPDLYHQIKAYRDNEMNMHSLKTAVRRWTRLAANYFVFKKPVYGTLHRAGLVGLDHRLSESTEFSGERLPADYASAYLDFQGRVGLAQLKKLDTIIKKRRTLAQHYAQELKDVPGIVLPPMVADANYSYYSTRIPQRDEINFRLRMLAKGIAVDETYEYALPYLKPYRRYSRTQYPRASEAARQVINLPIYPGLSATDAKHIAKSVRRVLESDFHGN